MNKRGGIGDGVVMIYRLLVVTVIAFVIFGVSSIFYDYNIDVRDAEARILTREVFDCLVPAGVFDLDEIPEGDYGKIVSYCGLLGSERFYVGVDVVDFADKEVVSLYEGDSGALWIKDLYGKVVVTGKAIVERKDDSGEGVGEYNPGYFKAEYPVFILHNGERNQGKVKMEVLVNYEK